MNIMLFSMPDSKLFHTLHFSAACQAMKRRTKPVRLSDLVAAVDGLIGKALADQSHDGYALIELRGSDALAKAPAGRLYRSASLAA